MSGERTIKLKFDGDARGAVRAGKQTERALGGVDESVDKSAKNVNKLDRQFGSASSSIIRDLDRMEKEAWESGEALDSSFSRSLRSIRSEVARLEAEAKQTGATLDSALGQSLLRARQQAEELSESLTTPPDVDLLGKIPLLAGGVAGVGAAVGSALWQGVQKEWQEDKIGGLIAAQTGAARGRAEKLGDVVGDSMLSPVVDSIEQAGEALTAVLQNKLIDTSAPEAALERLTERTAVLMQTTGEGANQLSRAVQQMLVTGLAGSVSEAQDIIQRATELGLGRFDDLLDTVQEYSTSWREVGIVGPEAMGLIAQATDAGARNTDIAADALKEFAIRAQDLSATTARGFRTLGLDADKMGDDIAAGGDRAREALRVVLNELQDMPPGVERSQAAVDLFGTKAEDLGDALFAMDLDTAAAEFGDFAGSVQDAARKIEDSQSFWDKLGRGVGIVTDKIGEAFDWLGDGDDEVSPFLEALRALHEAKARFEESGGDTTWLDEVKEKYPFVTSEVDRYIASKEGEIDASDRAAKAAEREAESLDRVLQQRRELATGTAGLAQANLDWFDSIDSAQAALEENGATLDATTEKGRNNTAALYEMADSALSVAEAMAKQGQDVNTVNGFLDDAYGKFIATATAMGMDAEQAKILARQLGLIPKDATTNVQVQGIGAAGSAVETYLTKLDRMRRAIDFLNTLPLRPQVVAAAGAGLGGGFGGGRAVGGPMQAGKSYLVGERGPEILVMPNSSGGTMVPNHALPAGGTTEVYVTIDGQQLQARIDRTVRSNNRDTRRAATSRTGRRGA